MMRATALLLLAALATGCRSAAAGSAAADGRAAAEREISEGSPRILFLGRPGPRSPLRDPATGLPRHSLTCIVSDESEAFVEAHNEVIQEALAAGRIR